jgi:hypothetical protein
MIALSVVHWLMGENDWTFAEAPAVAHVSRKVHAPASHALCDAGLIGVNHLAQPGRLRLAGVPAPRTACPVRRACPRPWRTDLGRARLGAALHPFVRSLEIERRPGTRCRDGRMRGSDRQSGGLFSYVDLTRGSSAATTPRHREASRYSPFGSAPPLTVKDRGAARAPQWLRPALDPLEKAALRNVPEQPAAVGDHNRAVGIAGDVDQRVERGRGRDARGGAEVAA